jgi:hypothetical protein
LHGDIPFALCDEQAVPLMTKLVGANNDEIALMNGLSVNIHVLMVRVQLIFVISVNIGRFLQSDTNATQDYD